MKPKETINLYRVISLLVIALVTFGVMGGLCAKSHLYPDEWLSMFFLTLIFLLVCMFELEYERKQKGISANTQTTFIRLSVTYTVSGGIDLCDQLSSGILPSGDDPGDFAHRSVKFHGGGVFWIVFRSGAGTDCRGKFLCPRCLYDAYNACCCTGTGIKRKKNTVWVYPF